MGYLRKSLAEKGIKLKGRGIMYGNRHGYATKLLEAKVPDADVAALMGWKGTTMLHKHYSHIAANRQRLREHLGHIKPISPPAEPADGGRERRPLRWR